ncbi:hypothetical protein [Ruegeria sp. R14_0]|uniref:hypothetical protein n=1 Tax=Ruegeria sp. R14_0 TaxID=2821100 RepID=UPI001FFDF302|nr:hypothetical protein [Ruegeria sp. R14_0]
MTTIKNSTPDVLAAITAQKLFHRSPSQATAVNAAGVSENAIPVSSVEQKEKKPRKETAEKKFKEQNITRFENKNGKFSYRVQIRKRVEGKQHSLTKTFRHLPNAKKWRNNKLREIEANGFPIQIVTETTISDVIDDRLKRGKTLGRSARQVLTFIKADEFGKTKVSTLTQQ